MLEALIAFKQLKKCLIITLVLNYYYIDRETILKTNAFDSIVIAVIFQKIPEGY